MGQGAGKGAQAATAAAAAAAQGEAANPTKIFGQQFDTKGAAANTVQRLHKNIKEREDTKRAAKREKFLDPARAALLRDAREGQWDAGRAGGKRRVGMSVMMSAAPQYENAYKSFKKQEGGERGKADAQTSGLDDDAALGGDHAPTPMYDAIMECIRNQDLIGLNKLRQQARDERNLNTHYAFHEPEAPPPIHAAIGAPGAMTEEQVMDIMAKAGTAAAAVSRNNTPSDVAPSSSSSSSIDVDDPNAPMAPRQYSASTRAVMDAIRARRQSGVHEALSEASVDAQLDRIAAKAARERHAQAMNDAESATPYRDPRLPWSPNAEDGAMSGDTAANRVIGGPKLPKPQKSQLYSVSTATALQHSQEEAKARSSQSAAMYDPNEDTKLPELHQPKLRSLAVPGAPLDAAGIAPKFMSTSGSKFSTGYVRTMGAMDPIMRHQRVRTEADSIERRRDHAWHQLITQYLNDVSDVPENTMASFRTLCQLNPGISVNTMRDVLQYFAPCGHGVQAAKTALAPTRSKLPRELQALAQTEAGALAGQPKDQKRASFTHWHSTPAPPLPSPVGASARRGA